MKRIDADTVGDGVETVAKNVLPPSLAGFAAGLGEGATRIANRHIAKKNHADAEGIEYP